MPTLEPQDQTPLEAITRNTSPELEAVTHPKPTTIPQQSKKLPDPLVFTSK